MADLTLDLSEETPILGEKTHEPFVFKSDLDTNSISNIMLIDSNVLESQIFYDSANVNTFPIIYSYDSGRDELLQLLQNKFTSLERISFVFHDSINGKTFLNNEPFFLETDIDPENLSLSPNVEFLLKIITDFAVKNVDFLQCNSLNHPNWVKYYDVLNKNTNVIVGGSSDETGNLQYGGNWIMENTTEDIQNVYLTSYISNYTSTLVDINGINNLYIRQNLTTKVVSYSTDPTFSTSTDISSNGWPATIKNTNPTTPLNVIFTNDIEVDGSNQTMQFEASSNFITFDGSWNNTRNTIRIRNITGYGGFFKNGGTSIRSNGFNNVAIRNFIVDVSDTTLGGSNNLSTGTMLNNLNNFISNLDGLHGFLTARCYGMGGVVSGVNHTYSPSNDLSLNTISNCSFRGLTSSNNLKTNFMNSRFIGDYASRHSSMTISGCDISGVNCHMIGAAFGSGTGWSDASYNKGIPKIINCSSNTGLPILGYNSASFNLDPSNVNVGLQITNFRNTGSIDINGLGSIAALVYSHYGRLILNGCSNAGNITSKISGGLLGLNFANISFRFGGLTMNNCYNTGLISSVGGGLIGRNSLYNLIYDSSINNCYNTGNVSGPYDNDSYTAAGGLSCGYPCANHDSVNSANKTLEFKNCYNTGIISGNRAGGLMSGGGENSFVTYIFTNCYNNGSINGTAGGIIGNRCSEKIFMNNCFT